MFDGQLPATLAEREAFQPRTARCARFRMRCADVLPADRAAASDTGPLDGLRTAVSLFGAARGFQPSLDVDDDELRANAMHVRGVPDARLRAVAPAAGPRPGRARTPPRLRGELPLHDAGQGSDAPSTRPRSRSTSSRPSTTASTRRRSRRGSSPRPAPTSAPRSSARSARCRARCTAARRAGRSRCSTRSAPPDRAEAWLRAAVERGDRLMGFGHRVYKTDDPRSLMLREVAESLGGEKMELARAHRGDRDRGARRAQAGPQALHERRVLRGHRDGPLRRPARDVHADVRVEPRDRLVRAHPRAGGRQPAHPPERALRGAPPPQPVPPIG